jgi:hypothetical protein
MAAVPTDSPNSRAIALSSGKRRVASRTRSCHSGDFDHATRPAGGRFRTEPLERSGDGLHSEELLLGVEVHEVGRKAIVGRQVRPDARERDWLAALRPGEAQPDPNEVAVFRACRHGLSTPHGRARVTAYCPGGSGGRAANAQCRAYGLTTCEAGAQFAARFSSQYRADAFTSSLNSFCPSTIH